MKRTPATVKALWDEFRVAAQFPKEWIRTEETLIAEFKRKGQPLPVDYEVGDSGVNAAWMEEIDPPGWFARFELGRNDADHVWMTPAELAGDNRRRMLEEVGRQNALSQAA